MGSRLLLQTRHTLDGSSASRSTQILWTDYLILLFYLLISLLFLKKISGETWQTQEWLIFGVHTNLEREMAKNWKLCIKTLDDQNWETELWYIFEMYMKLDPDILLNPGIIQCIAWKDFQSLWWYDLRFGFLFKFCSLKFASCGFKLVLSWNTSK